MDEDTFDSFTAPHIPTMVRIAAVLIGQANAEDAVQEALLRAWQARVTLRDVSSLPPWLFRITVNICHDWQRSHFSAERWALEIGNDSVLGSVADDPGSATNALRLDLRHAVDALPEEYRLIIELRYYVGLDASEIGTALDLPPATVRTRIRRGLDRLRQQLATSTSALEGIP